ncbi:glucose-6-phosphate exchanger SLC37A4-like [Antedon mediterranea]|uniref:glucose-6-phosphate exchanger SLC37A4-like n=1 Tax=Antedon mediterranea TaxID=105859 RepID=UPI003AF94869
MSRLGTWQIVMFSTMFVGYTLYYYNRKSFSFIMPYVIEEDNFDKPTLGAITSSIYMSYTLSKFAGGIMSDKVNASRMFPFGLLGVGLLVVAFTLCTSLKMMVVVWFVQGLFQGMGWPACGKLLKKWFPPSKLGIYWSLLSTSMNIAGGAGPVVAALLSSSYGWRTALQASGLVAIFVSFLSFFILKESPSEVGIETAFTHYKKKKDTSEPTSVIDVVRTPFLWVLIIYCLLNIFMANAISDWGQLYLIQELNYSPTTGGVFVSAFQIGAVIGSIVAGYVTDKQVNKQGLRDAGSARFPFLLVTILALLSSLHCFNTLVSSESNLVFICVLSFIMGFCAFGHQSLNGVLVIEHSTPVMSGTAHAFFSLGGGVGAVLAGYPLSIVAKHFNWYTSLIIVEGAVILHLLIMLSTWNISTAIGKRRIKSE